MLFLSFMSTGAGLKRCMYANELGIATELGVNADKYRVVMNEKYGYVGSLYHITGNSFKKCDNIETSPTTTTTTTTKTTTTATAKATTKASSGKSGHKSGSNSHKKGGKN